MQPDPDRVRRVSRRQPSIVRFVTRRPRSERPSSGRRSPQRGSYPSKHSPRRQPCRITAALALLPLSPPPVVPGPAEAGRFWWFVALILTRVSSEESTRHGGSEDVHRAACGSKPPSSTLPPPMPLTAPTRRLQRACRAVTQRGVRPVDEPCTRHHGPLPKLRPVVPSCTPNRAEARSGSWRSESTPPPRRCRQLATPRRRVAPATLRRCARAPRLPPEPSHAAPSGSPPRRGAPFPHRNAVKDRTIWCGPDASECWRRCCIGARTRSVPWPSRSSRSVPANRDRTFGRSTEAPIACGPGANAPLPPALAWASVDDLRSADRLQGVAPPTSP